MQTSDFWNLDWYDKWGQVTAGFLESEKSFKKLRGHVDLKILVNSLRPAAQQLKKAA